MPQGVSVGEGGAQVAEGGQEPVERPEADTGDAVGAQQCVDLIFVVVGVGAGGPPEGEGGGVPDGVDDNVVDGVEWAEAVATNEEAAREGGAGGPPELGGGQPRDSVEVASVDDVQQPPLHGPLVRLRPSLTVGRGGGCFLRLRVLRRLRRHLSAPAAAASTPASHATGDRGGAIFFSSNSIWFGSVARFLEHC